jgi:hypothetical protein
MPSGFTFVNRRILIYLYVEVDNFLVDAENSRLTAAVIDKFGVIPLLLHVRSN